jgi:hypothetical protein
MPHRYHQIKLDQQASLSFNLPADLPTETIRLLDKVASAYRNVLIAYSHNILDVVQKYSKNDESLLECHWIRTLLLRTKHEAISCCMRDISSVPEDSNSAIGLAPILFIVATETHNSTEFEMAAARFSRLEKTSRLGNLNTARELLKMIKQDSTKDWRHVLRACNWDLIIS